MTPARTVGRPAVHGEHARSGRAGERGAVTEIEQARVAKAHLRAALAGRRGVQVGLRRRADGYCLLVNLVDAADGAELPEQVDGVPVDVRVVGPVRAQG